ncbi:MAG TPA: hypothetical protein VFT49_02940 [Candidatus Saccharimonadales bacterium]|nr:hypothetical protein [Candidatus Saccharimonadales bacterium]
MMAYKLVTRTKRGLVFHSLENLKNRPKGDDVVRRFILILAAAIAAAALAAFTSVEQADAQSSVAAAAVHHCSQVKAASSHRDKSLRVLSSAKLSKARRMCAEVRRRVGTVHYWNNPQRRWTLYRHYQRYTCWDLRRKHLLEGPEGLCAVARGAVRVSTERLVKLDKQIKPLLPQPKIKHDWLYHGFVCIHGFEGAWNANTGNGYYGGLQMDLPFQNRYGADFMARWGTANNWPAWAQMIAASRAYYSGRGFDPWPNTARACGYSTAPISSRSV